MANNSARPGNRVVQQASALVMGLGLVMSTVLFPVASFASTGTYQATSPINNPVTIPAGGTVSLTIRGFCLEYGKPFPTGSMTVKGLAPDKVREALYYSIQKGYTDSNARQVELGIWNIQDNTWHATPHDIGTEVVSNATAANMPPAGTTGTSLADAIAQNKVTASATFTPQTADEFYGDGQVQVKNSGTSDISVYMPVGVQFTAGANGSFQDLVAYQLSAPAQATGTASPATTATGTVSASPVVTGTSVVTGTATVEPTGTVAATSTVSASPIVTGTAVATDTATVSATTPTAAATTAVETPTAMATVAATQTTAPVATETPMATATTAVPGTLPQTGSGGGINGTAAAILIMGLLLTLAGSTALIVSKRRA